MNKRHLLTAVVVAAVAVGLITTVFLLRPPPFGGDRPTAVAVRLKWLHQAQFAGFHAAKEKGFYKEQGLDVTLNPGGPDFPAVQMVAGGGEDFGVTGGDQILLAREKGVPVVAIAVIYRKSPFVLFSLKESAITTPQDFAGKKVGVKLGGNEELTYRAMMRKVGINAEDVTELPVKFDMTPLFTGQVDVWPGYAINEPIVAEEKGHEVNLIWPSDYGIDLYADTLFATESTIAQRPDLVKRFVHATLRGWEYALAHPEEAVEYTLKYGANLNRDHEGRMMEASIPLVKPDESPVGSMERGKWEAMQVLLLEQGFMKAPIDIDNVFTTKFLDAGPRAPSSK